MTAPDPVQEEFNQEDETEVIVNPVEYPEMCALDEQRRAFVLKYMADAEIDGRIFVSNMAAVEQWLRDGTVPKDESKPRAKLKPVEKVS